MAEAKTACEAKVPLAEFQSRFLFDKHREYVLGLDKKTDTFEFYATEHLRMSGAYWATMALYLLGHLDKVDTSKLIPWVMSCQHANGGFSGNEGHDPHILYTLSAVQILAIFDRMELLDADLVASYVAGLQQDNGAFIGDKWGEVDTRFSYCALNCLALLGKLDKIDVPKATEFGTAGESSKHLIISPSDAVARCKNFDGGFGTVPGAESHSGQIFCCVGALAIGNALDQVDGDVLGWWLAERQLPCGGLNGRPEKKEDVCYSWWVLSALSILRRISWIDRVRLGDFIVACQDTDDGGISDRPGNIADVYHTYFGCAGLSLLGYPGFKAIDPVYAMPVDVIQRLGLEARYSAQ